MSSLSLSDCVHFQSPVYELTVANRGPKLPAAQDDGSSVRAAESLPRVEDDSVAFLRRRDGGIRADVVSIARNRPARLDHTAIPGTFDLILNPAPGAAAAKARFEVLIFDHAERPEAN
jgi:hypothetical protein